MTISALLSSFERVAVNHTCPGKWNSRFQGICNAPIFLKVVWFITIDKSTKEQAELLEPTLWVTWKRGHMKIRPKLVVCYPRYGSNIKFPKAAKSSWIKELHMELLKFQVSSFFNEIRGFPSRFQKHHLWVFGALWAERVLIPSRGLQKKWHTTFSARIKLHPNKFFFDTLK